MDPYSDGPRLSGCLSGSSPKRVAIPSLCGCSTINIKVFLFFTYFYLEFSLLVLKQIERIWMKCLLKYGNNKT